MQEVCNKLSKNKVESRRNNFSHADMKIYSLLKRMGSCQRKTGGCRVGWQQEDPSYFLYSDWLTARVNVSSNRDQNEDKYSRVKKNVVMLWKGEKDQCSGNSGKSNPNGERRAVKTNRAGGWLIGGLKTAC